MSTDLTYRVDQRPYDEDEMAEILAAWLGSPRLPTDEMVARDHLEPA